ncbi:MAG: succinoglycan biosynthesis protein [Phenylobacterium sp.]|nr:succinoglycan biosynthesis protein [Phenylobacterium sp.]
MKLAYFVHDLTDPAVARRVRMLRAGGAEPVVLGFRREPAAPEAIEGAPAIDLGRTYDARLGHRAAKTALAALGAARLREHLRGAEVVMARTLEMLAVAQAARAMSGARARLVYECLDIHRLMLSPGAKGRALRAAERTLMRRADLLAVSSPAFLDAYFEPVQGVGRDIRIETLLIENKVVELEPEVETPSRGLPPGPPWRIGWMGAIRCRKSLAILTDLARRRPHLVEVRIHGRPAYSEFDDFDGQVAALPNLTFGGGYRPQDLPRLYGEVHFAWAIDFMEEGLNSAWLLPNRLYEASRHGALPIALGGVETGRYLRDLGIGVRLDRAEDLQAALEALTPRAFAALRNDLDAVPLRTFVADAADCRDLVDSLAGRSGSFVSAEASFRGARNLAGKGRAQPEHYPGEAV